MGNEIVNWLMFQIFVMVLIGLAVGTALGGAIALLLVWLL